MAKPPNPYYRVQMILAARESGRLVAVVLRGAVALVTCLWLVFSSGPVAAQDAVSVKGELFDDFGRLTFDWGKVAPPQVGVSVDQRQLVLRFDRAVTLGGDAVRLALMAYVRSAQLAEGGRLLTIELKRPVTYRLARDGARMRLDLAQPNEAILPNNAGDGLVAAPERAAATEGQPPESPPGPGPRLKLRTGEHSGYSRLAIDWPDVGFTMQQDGTRASVTFSKPARLDVPRTLPPRVRAIVASADARGNLTLEIDLLPGVGLNGFRNGDTVVVDIRDGETTEPTAAAPTPAATVPQTVAEPSATDTPLETGTAPALQSAMPVAVEPEGPVPTVQIAPAVVVTKEPAVSAATPPPAPVAIIAKASRSESGAVIELTFPQPTGLAAFRRGDAVWLVFDRPGPVDLAALVKEAPALSGLERIESPYATVLRLPDVKRLGGGDMGAGIEGDGRRWQVSLGPGRDLRPAQAIDQRRETLADGGASLLLTAVRPGPVLVLQDPEAGDLVSVVPLAAAGQGVADGAAWPDFRVLPSFQGVAVVPVSDRTRIEALPNGVVVTTDGVPGAVPAAVAPKPISEMEPPPLDGQVAVTTTAIPATAATKAVDPGATEPGGAEPAAVAAGDPAELVIAPVVGIFDLPRWRGGGEATFKTEEEALKRAVDESAAGAKDIARLALAQFHFAHGRYREAVDDLALLESVAASGNRDVLTLRGAARALAEHDDEAIADLSRPELKGVPEAAVFSAFVAARRGEWEKAAEPFRAAIPSLDDYPKPARMEIRRAAAEALIRANDLLTAQAFLDAIRIDMPNATELAYYEFLLARHQLAMGDKAEAMKTLAGLAKSPVGEVRARSQFDLTELELEDGRIDQREAASRLDALRFLWRGTDFEFDLLYRLGELYLASSQPRRGLVTLRQAATNFPDNPRAKAATDLMTRGFHDLYLGDKADELAPLTAVALYDEFRELTPTGAEGDRMITSLADRLVRVDLLDGAARLLVNQVEKRLGGEEKARVGSRLAAIRLLDGKPEQAIEALKSSETPEMPAEIIEGRRRLEARALFDLGDTLQGLALVRDDNSLDGLWLKADFNWRQREWPAAADSLAELIAAETDLLRQDDPSLRPPSNLSEDPGAALAGVVDDSVTEQTRTEKFNRVLAPLILNQAVALSLANDRAGLRMLAKAQGKEMETGPFATAFATLTSPSSSLADSISATMKSVDQLGAFVEDYRARLKAASLSTMQPPAEAVSTSVPVPPAQ